jgi:hypothetical protein
MTTIKVFGEDASKIAAKYDITEVGDSLDATATITLKSVEGRTVVEVEV